MVGLARGGTSVAITATGGLSFIALLLWSIPLGGRRRSRGMARRPSGGKPPPPACRSRATSAAHEPRRSTASRGPPASGGPGASYATIHWPGSHPLGARPPSVPASRLERGAASPSPRGLHRARRLGAGVASRGARPGGPAPSTLGSARDGLHRTAGEARLEGEARRVLERVTRLPSGVSVDLDGGGAGEAPTVRPGGLARHGRV